MTPEQLADLAHLRRGELSVTEVCMAVGVYLARLVQLPPES